MKVWDIAEFIIIMATVIIIPVILAVKRTGIFKSRKDDQKDD